MTQEEKRKYLIKYMLAERNENISFPDDEIGQKALLRALFNVREPSEASEEFLRVQDEYLHEQLRLKGITDIDSLTPIRPGIYLWRGDITTFKCDGIVNAANKKNARLFLSKSRMHRQCYPHVCGRSASMGVL